MKSLLGCKIHKKIIVDCNFYSFNYYGTKASGGMYLKAIAKADDGVIRSENSGKKKLTTNSFNSAELQSEFMTSLNFDGNLAILKTNPIYYRITFNNSCNAYNYVWLINIVL